MAEVLSVDVVESPANEQESSSDVIEPSCSMSMSPDIVWDDFNDSTCSSVESNYASYIEDEFLALSKISLKEAENKHQLELKKVEFKLKELMHEKERQERNNQKLLDELSKSNKKYNDLQKSKLKLRQELEHSERLKSQLLEKLDKSKREIEERDIENAKINKEKKAYFLRSIEQENIVNNLTNQLKHLRLTNCKRNAVDEKHNNIQDMYNSGLDRLEMVVVTWIAETTGDTIKYYYRGFRRRLKGMLHAISDKIDVARGDIVKVWFVTNNAKQDFIDSKEYLKDNADKTGVTLNMKANNISFVNSSDVGRFDTVESFRKFGKIIGMIELNAEVLQTVLKLLQNQMQLPEPNLSDLQTLIGPESGMVNDIYNYVVGDYRKSLTRHTGRVVAHMDVTGSGDVRKKIRKT